MQIRSRFPPRSRAPIVAAAILLVLGLLLSPVGSGLRRAAAPRAQSTGVLVIDTNAEAESMDPAFVVQISGNSIVSSVFDSLVERGYDGTIQPMLAESWSIPDPTTVEFRLRQGVTFHNGERFQADAVKFSIDRLMDPGRAAPQAAAMPRSFTGVEVVDDFTVRFHFRQPEAAIFDALAQCCAIVAPAYYAQNPPEFVGANPVGTGPFRFVEWVRDDHTTLAANSAYWGASTYKGRPLVPSVVFRPVPTAATRLADLLNGTADIIFDVSADDVDAIRDLASSGFQVVPSAAARFQFVAFMPRQPTDPLADRRVRQALNYAVDVQSLIDNLFKGLGSRQASPILSGALGHDPSVQPYAYNPALAQQLLAEAGYPQGFSATLDISSSDNPATALAVAGQLRQVGVEVTPRTLELALFNANWSPGKSGDLRFARWSGMQDPAVFLGFTTVCGGLLADPYICNPEITELAREAGSTLDQEQRARLYSRISRMLREDPMAIYLSNAVSIFGAGPRVQGWRGPNGRDYVIPTNLVLNG